MTAEEEIYIRQIIETGLAALQEHGEETGHGTDSFLLNEESATFSCSVCETIVYRGPAFEPEA